MILYHLETYYNDHDDRVELHIGSYSEKELRDAAKLRFVEQLKNPNTYYHDKISDYHRGQFRRLGLDWAECSSKIFIEWESELDKDTVLQ